MESESESLPECCSSSLKFEVEVWISSDPRSFPLALLLRFRFFFLFFLILSMVDTTTYNGMVLSSDMVVKALLGGINRRMDKKKNTTA